MFRIAAVAAAAVAVLLAVACGHRAGSEQAELTGTLPTGATAAGTVVMAATATTPANLPPTATVGSPLPDLPPVAPTTSPAPGGPASTGAPSDLAPTTAPTTTPSPAPPAVPTAPPAVELSSPLPTRQVRFTVRVPANTPVDATVHLLILPFTHWEWTAHLPMARHTDGTWTVVAEVDDGALLQYAYDIWDESDWGQFEPKREAATDGIPVDRRLLVVSPDTNEVTDIVASWRESQASPATGVIEGLVTDPSGAPVVDSEVTVAGIHASTDWDGRYSVEVAAGHQRVTVYRADGAHLPAVKEVDVPTGGVASADFTVTAVPEVPVTFSVQLPPGTGPDVEVRMAGSVRQLGSSTGWPNTPPVTGASIRLPVLDRTSPTTAQATFLLHPGTYIQYFYTLSSDSLGREWTVSPTGQPFRSMVVGPERETRRDAVAAWSNPDWPVITFRVTVPLNTPAGVPIVFGMGPQHWMSQVGPTTWQLSISSIPNQDFRYRYLIGGEGIGYDGTPGTEGDGFRTAHLGETDVVVEDLITRWANLPEAANPATGTPVRVRINVSVPVTTTPGAVLVWQAEDGASEVPMTAASGNPWLYSVTIELVSGVEARYRVRDAAEPSMSGSVRSITPAFDGQEFGDWVTAWPEEPASMRPGYLTGFFTPDLWSAGYLPLSDTTYGHLAEHNGNAVAVSSVWSYGTIRPLPTIEPRPIRSGSVLTPRDDLVAQISIAHAHGLQVVLVPQFNMEMSEGGIGALNDLPPGWWDEWLRQAERMWMWNAQVAEETHSEVLLLPGFVFHVFAGPGAFESDDAFNSFDSKLAALVEEVRSVYSGKLLISGGVAESEVPGLADYVGVTTFDIGNPDLPVDASVEQWRDAYEELVHARVDPMYERWGKRVVVYQLGISARTDDPEPSGQSLQARRIEALMQTLSARSWISGSLSWSYDMIDAPLFPGDGLRGRLAESVLAKYYGAFNGVE